MPCSRRPESAFRLVTRALLAAALSLLPSAVLAGGISIDYAATKPVGPEYQLDARIRFDLGEEIAAAVEHGVELHIDVFVHIKRERKWLWDPELVEKSLAYKLEHHPLSQDYVVTALDRDTLHQFPSIDAALKYIGEVNNLPLVAADALAADSSYTGYIRAGLNIQMLPAPLQPAAYVSEKWRMQSAWYEWVVR